MAEIKPKLRWFQFSLSTLLVIMTIAAIGAALANWMGFQPLVEALLFLSIFSWPFAVVYWIISRMQKSGNRNNVRSGHDDGEASD